MKKPAVLGTFRTLCFLVGALVFAGLAILPARATTTNYLNSSLPSGSYDLDGAYWNTTSETNMPLAIFDAPGSLVIGQNPGDFNGETLIIPWDISGTTKIITSAGTNITIGSTNVVVTINGSQNNYIDAACTISVAAGSTLIEADTHDQGLNFNSQTVTLAGGGTIIFQTSVGGNSSAILTENMPGGMVVLEQTNNPGTDYLLSGGYTLTSGALVFGTATAASGAFTNFASGKLFKISGGSIDNTSGSAQTLSLGLSTCSLGGNFTFNGSSSLSFNTNAVALTANVVVTNLASTLTMGAISGAGFGLTATGPGIMAIAGNSTYTGATVVQAGTLALTGSATTNLTQTSSIEFLTNSIFDLSALTGQLVNPNTLSLTNTTLLLSIPLNSTTNVVVGNLALGGTNNIIKIFALPVLTHYPTTFPLINYSNTLSLTNFSLAALPVSPSIPYAGYLTTSNANLVELVLTNGPVPARSLVWAGNDPSNPTFWDVQTSFNWLTNAADPATTYNQLDLVLFNDTSVHSASPGQVALQTTLTPSTLTVSNNALNYTFTGGGLLADPLTAPLQLVKQGTGTLILDNSQQNTYSGGTLISGGTIQLGTNNDGGGSLGTGPVVNNGAINLQNGYITVPNAFSGSGSILQNGPGPVILSGTISGSGSIFQYGAGTLNLGGANAAFTGTITVVTNGVLQAGSASAFGAASRITVQSGGVLDLNGQSIGAIPVVAQGAGNIPNGGSQGAIDNSSATAPPDDLGLEFLTLTGNTTLSTSGGRWDLRSPENDAGVVGTSAASSTAALSTGGQPHNLTIQGQGFLGIVSAWVDPALADIDVLAGTLDYEGNTSGLGNPNDTLTVESGATFELWNAANPLNKVIVVNDSATVFNGSGATNVISGPIILTNAGSACAFNVAAGTALSLEGVVSGQGTLEASPLGTLILNGGNTFSGGLEQSQGTVILNGDNSTLTNYNLINGGTFTLDGIFGGDTTNENGASLSGTGTNLGAVDVIGTIAPGGSNTVGTFTVGGPTAPSSLTLESSANATFIFGGTTTVGGAVNDLIVVNGNLTIESGATITINPFDILASGPYVLFTYTGTLSVPGGLASISLPGSPGGYNFVLSTSTPHEVTVTASGGPTTVWTGGAGASDTTWENPANWGGTAISLGDDLYFSGNASLNNTNNFATDTQFGNITFASVAGPFVLNGNNIEMGSGVLINNSSHPETVDLGVDFDSSFAFYGGNTAGAPLIIGGGLNINNSGNDTSVYLNGYGVLSNNFANNAGAGLGSNAMTMTNTGANWTMLDNPTSTPVTLPWGFEIMAGTFTFGSATSAPNFDSTPATGLVNGADDTFIGDIAGGTGTFNMVNGTLTLAARIDVGEIAGSTGIVNQSGGTLNLTEMQTGNESGIAFVNISGGTMNIAGNPYYNATRTNATLTMTGGALICSTLDVSRCVNSSVPGLVNLNGGALTCSRVSTATSAGSVTATGDTATFNFNGGTLVASASSTTFYQGSIVAPIVPITSMVKSNGAIINDGGFAISILEPLQHDPTLGNTLDGGLNKLGTGTNTLGKANTYTGPTVINAGTLVLSSPGNIAASVSINIAAGATLNPGATLTLPSGQTLEGGGNVTGNLTSSAGSTVSPGSSNATGTLTVSGAVSLGGSTYMKLNGAANDELISSSSLVSYGGTLVVTNLPGNTLAAGDTFTLFHGSSYANSFASITLPALGANLAWQTNLGVNGSISVVSTVLPTSPSINSVAQEGGNLIFSGTNGPDGGTYYVLTSSSLSLPLSKWTVLSTNSFSASGSFSVTNPIVTGGPPSFFVLEIP